MCENTNSERRPVRDVDHVAPEDADTAGNERVVSDAPRNHDRDNPSDVEMRVMPNGLEPSSEITRAGASGLVEREEKDMNRSESARSKLSDLYAKKREAGLVDVSFFLGNVKEASFDDVAVEVLRLEGAIRRGEFREFRFNDKR